MYRRSINNRTIKKFKLNITLWKKPVTETFSCFFVVLFPHFTLVCSNILSFPFLSCHRPKPFPFFAPLREFYNVGVWVFVRNLLQSVNEPVAKIKEKSIDFQTWHIPISDLVDINWRFHSRHLVSFFNWLHQFGSDIFLHILFSFILRIDFVSSVDEKWSLFSLFFFKGAYTCKFVIYLRHVFH